MKISNTLKILAVGLVVSTAVLASSQDEADSTSEMPMMNQGHSMMMNPETMNRMMNPEMMEQMLNHQAMHQMMHQMPHMAYGHGMPMMEQGMGNMMGPQMMQMRMQHMIEMERHLQRIESLLAQILEAQKSK